MNEHHEQFWDALISEAVSGDKPAYVLSRIQARASAGAAPHVPAQAPTGRRAPTTRRWKVARILGALMLSVALGAVSAVAATRVIDQPQAPATTASLRKEVDKVDSRIALLDAAQKGREIQVRTLEERVAWLQRNSETNVEVMERVMRERDERRDAQHKERHLAFIEKFRAREREQTLASLDKNVKLTAEQKSEAGKLLDQWVGSGAAYISGYYRGHRRDTHGTREKLDEVTAQTRDGLRALLDSRQQLAFDDWIARSNSALARGSESWVPAAVDNGADPFADWR